MSEAVADEEMARQYLQGLGVPQFLDRFIRRAVTEQPQDFKPLLRAMLKADLRGARKGDATTPPVPSPPAPPPRSAEFGPSEALPPAYCLRDPRIRPTAEQIRAKGVVTSPAATRSEILEPQFNKDYATTIAALFNAAAAACQAAARGIQAECSRQRKPFFDQSFWYGHRATMYPKGAPADCTVAEPKRAQRAGDLYPNAPLFAGGAGSLDIRQGAIGDGFFIGAVSALAGPQEAALKPLERLFAFADAQWGIYGVCFFKNGEWEWVLVDDWVAVDGDGATQWPQYAGLGGAPELWPLLLEKAYAKLHFCWDSIDGGIGRQALEDLTGGLSFSLNLYKDDRGGWGGPDGKRFRALVDDPYTVECCSVGRHVTEAQACGLAKGRAYSIDRVAEAAGASFVLLRNPWGKAAEWRGSYAPGSPEWGQNPAVAAALRPEAIAEGTAWVPWDDFRRILTEIDVIRFFPQDWCVLSLVGKASKTDICDKNTFLLEVTRPVRGLVLGLGQNDPLTSLDHVQRKAGVLAQCTLACYTLTRKPADYGDLQGCLGAKRGAPSARTHSVFLEGDFDPGLYALIPRFSDMHRVGLYVRVFCPPDADVAVWRWTDTHKWTAAEAKVAAASVPDCAPRDAPPPERLPSDIAPTITSRGDAGAGTKTVLASLGCDSEAQYNELLSRAFAACDRFNRNTLTVPQAREAVQFVLAESPVVAAGFQRRWEALARNSPTYEIRSAPFTAMMQQVLADMYAFQQKIREGKGAGTPTNVPVSGTIAPPKT